MASTERSPDVSSLPEAEAKEKADMVERSPPTLVPEGGATAPARDSNNDTGAESPARTASPAAATDGSDRRGREHHDATKITASEDEGSPSERSVVTASSDWDTIGTQRGRVRRRERPRDYSVMSDPRYARDAREGWGHIPQEQRGGAIRGLSEPLAAYMCVMTAPQTTIACQLFGTLRLITDGIANEPGFVRLVEGQCKTGENANGTLWSGHVLS